MSAPPLAAARRRVLLHLAAFFAGGLSVGISLLVGGLFVVLHLAEGLDGFASTFVGTAGCAAAICGVLVLRALRPVRQPPAADEGLPIEEATEPALVALVDEVAARVGARLPREIRLCHGAGIACQQVRRDGGRRCRVEIGMPELQALDRAELEALLAFHLAHEADGDLELRRKMARALAAIDRTATREIGALPAIFRRLRRNLLAAWEGYEAAHVLAMDAVAATCTGARAHRSALRRSAVLGPILDRFLNEEVQPVLQERLLPADLWEGYRLCLRALEASGQLAEMEREAIEAPAEDGRPTLAGRLAALRNHAAQAPATRPHGGEAARALLCDAGGMERATAARWIGPATGETIGWEASAEKVWGARFRRASAELRRALPPSMGLFDAIEWMAASTQVAIAAAAWPRVLDAELDGEGRERYARQLVQRGLAGWIGEELVARGWRWDTAPGYAVELEGPQGERISPLALLAPLGTEPGATEALRDRLAALGLDRPAVRLQAAPRKSVLLH